MTPTGPEGYDVVVVGGGHNALVAATYLARTGRRVVVLEAADRLGGAVAGGRPFPGVDALLSRFSYLVSLLPQSLVDELGLDLQLASRRIASCTPVGDAALVVERVPGAATAASFAALAPDDEPRWRRLEERLTAFAAVVAPTLTGPLPRLEDVRAQVEPELWRALVERPLGALVEESLADDALRGLVLTDALIGTSARAHEPDLRQNRCFLYHVVGRGTGEWKVPVGGMGRVAAELVRVATGAGAQLRTGARVTGLAPQPGGGATVTLADGSTLTAPHVLVGCAPAALPGLASGGAVRPEGSQTKVNLVLARLPRLRSGVDPATAFAGTLHLAQGYARLDEAWAEAEAGRLPDPLPVEAYCHSLTDPTILGPDLRAAGAHTLTLFALHTPARLFVDDPDGARAAVGAAALRSLQAVLAEPLEDCLAHDADGRACVEVMTPLDVEAELSMPGGHIFHGDLVWPWLPEGAQPATAAERWGVATALPGVLLCGAAAVRGGAVSGLGGHDAAMAVLEETGGASRFDPSGGVW
ncbi:phytoene desaturase family protein [Microlunatus capsulatus]|uniref:Pyridine nucleotide-disulfide oxidoreductase domain-containing protein 2 n=1 Tax=Microlunatus capsulatus TaxID=99117 RepID=A0ABS4Z5K9_9ACTN|nr:NAD(P)/FAD-dependent oxidoreductase [Microlunatus capsulatus]MBP2416271.1 phytoene dehydrogenase-like protein [Microlunatus capsulatus]